MQCRFDPSGDVDMVNQNRGSFTQQQEKQVPPVHYPKDLNRIVVYLGLLLLLCINSFSQVFKSENPKQYKINYLNYLVHPDSTNRTTLLNASYEYLYMPKAKVFSTNGMNFKIGLNLARFFTRKIILGVCFDFKYINGFSAQQFSSNFVNDFNNSFNSYYSSSTDSAKAYILYNVVNGNSKYRMKGNNFANVGFEFSPFPNRYGGILIRAKIGFRDYLINGLKGNQFTSNKDLDKLPLSIKNNYALELSFKPYRFFNSKIIDILHMRFWELYKFIVVSFYYERLNIKAANFDGTSLDQIVDQRFLSKYGQSDSFGIKLGLAIY